MSRIGNELNNRNVITEKHMKIIKLHAMGISLSLDIVNFTDFSAEREPFEVVEMLKELFKRFDDTCKLTNCYKVHTIGDCYVVLSFTGKIPIHERNYVEEARNVIKMGEKMIQIIKEVRTLVNFEPLNMRIGIHTVLLLVELLELKLYDTIYLDRMFK